MGGLGALLAYLGGGGYVATCWMYTQISQIKPIYDIIQVRRCNCKQQERKRLKSHYIACNTDVSHISRSQAPHNSQEMTQTHAHRAYLNPHITCRHYTPHYTAAHTRRHYTAPYTTHIHHAGLIPRGSAALHTYTTRRYICYTHTSRHNPHKNRIITTFYPYFVKI